MSYSTIHVSVGVHEGDSYRSSTPSPIWSHGTVDLGGKRMGYISATDIQLSFHDFAGINELIKELQLLRAELHLLTGEPPLEDSEVPSGVPV